MARKRDEFGTAGLGHKRTGFFVEAVQLIENALSDFLLFGRDARAVTKVLVGHAGGQARRMAEVGLIGGRGTDGADFAGNDCNALVILFADGVGQFRRFVCGLGATALSRSLRAVHADPGRRTGGKTDNGDKSENGLK